jgi:hypothetical protein
VKAMFENVQIAIAWHLLEEVPADDLASIL